MAIRRKRDRYGRKSNRPVLIGITAVMLVFFVVMVHSLFAAPDPSSHIQEDGEQAAAAIDFSKYDVVTKTAEDIGQGDLILVNADHPFDFTHQTEKPTVYSQKNDCYKVKDKLITINPHVGAAWNAFMEDFYADSHRDYVTVVSAYRTYAYQKGLYENKVRKDGQQEADRYVQRPGTSEHHTGNALDLGVTDDRGVYYEFDGTGEYRWIGENAHRYGFIVRYAQEKASITKIYNEPWHLRYVGKPHAYLMKEKNMCLEEYIDYLKQFSFSKQHLNVEDDQHQRYQIYYVPSDGQRTEIPVPKDNQYTISGNNVDGFLVTVSLES